MACRSRLKIGQAYDRDYDYMLKTSKLKCLKDRKTKTTVNKYLVQLSESHLPSDATVDVLMLSRFLLSGGLRCCI